MGGGVKGDDGVWTAPPVEAQRWRSAGAIALRQVPMVRLYIHRSFSNKARQGEGGFETNDFPSLLLCRCPEEELLSDWARHRESRVSSHSFRKTAPPNTHSMNTDKQQEARERGSGDDFQDPFSWNECMSTRHCTDADMEPLSNTDCCLAQSHRHAG